MRWWLGVVLAVASPAAASLQTDYNAAQAALDAGKYREARDGFAALLAKLPPAQAHTAALLAARTGIAERRLGNPVAAIARLTGALAGLDPANDAAERIAAGTELGLAYENNADDASAARTYAAVAGEAGFAADPLSTTVRLGAVRTKIFTDPAAARRELDVMLPAMVTTFKNAKTELAGVYALRGRIELNDHQYPAAAGWFAKALDLTGGLSDRVTVPAQQARGDLAIAAFLRGDEEGAHRYLAFTGTGYLPLEALRFGEAMPPPPCAPLTALRPDDVAVIEIAIADSGRIARATTIYASRTGGPETLFAQAARDWKWQRSAVQKLPPFYRQALRLEVRCSTSRGDDPIGIGLFARDIERWEAASRIEPLPELPDDPAAAEAALAAELARRTAAFGPDSPQLVPVLFASIDGADEARTQQLVSRLAALAAAAGAPADVVLVLRGHAGEPGSGSRGAFDRARREQATRLPPLIAEAVAHGQGDSRGVAYLRLVLARAAERLKDDDTAVASLRAVIAAPLATVPAGDPIRVAALLRLASIEAAHKQVAEAQSLFRATGLDAEQCALVDVAPLPTRQSVGEGDFPREALRWNFDGLVRVGYDIDTAGKPVNIRTITAVPPFVFDRGTERTARNFRYRPIFRDGPGIGCSGHSSNVRYQVAGISR